MMRVLVLLAALLSMPALAADYMPWPDADAEPAGIELLAQAMPQGQLPGQPQVQLPSQPQGQSQDGQQQNGPQRYPGDYCTRHCRPNEIPCGDGCMAKKGNVSPKCTEKKTTTCPGKP
jgi:hypothetical protein